MILAAAIAEAEDELICDFAEVYHIYDYRALQPRLAATLAAGLRENSRVKMKLSGEKYGKDTYLLAAIADRLSYLVWFKTKDWERNRPKSFVEALMGVGQVENDSDRPMAFGSKEELDEALGRYKEHKKCQQN